MTDEASLYFPQQPLPGVTLSSIEAQARAVVASDMEIVSIQTPRDPAHDGLVVLRGRLLRPSAAIFSRWLQQFRALGYTPILRHDSERGGVQEGDQVNENVALHVMPGIAQKAHPKIWINIVLFVATVISTLFVGSLYGDVPSNVNSAWDLFRPANLLAGWPFALTLLGILSAHEFGHYFAARYHRVAVTLPYFIPMPLGFGTLGAFIQLREPVPDRRKLFDIGVAGPLAGLIVALPLLFIGLSTSPVEIIAPSPGAMLEGNSVLYYYAKVAVFGQALPNAITGEDVLMNRVTFAAWIGLLVTALNLLPVGQLDGGHIVYALFGDKARYINVAAMLVMAGFALAGLEPLQRLFPPLVTVGYTGWFFWLALILFLIGPYHPPALDDVSRLDRRRRLVGYLAIILFILIFVPVPMRPLA